MDLETKKSFQEVGGKKPEELGVSVVGIYSYEDDSYKAFLEKELEQLFPMLEQASFLVGFNINRFDLLVLQPYYVGNLSKLVTLDILEEVKKVLGKRIALDDLARETLGVKKSGHGLLAINYYKEGRLEKLKRYCLSDVKLTRDLFEYGKKHGRLFYKDVYGRQEIKVNWQDLNQKTKEINLTLPI